MGPRSEVRIERPPGPLALAALAWLISACSPVTVSHIGPAVPPRDPGCEIEVLEEGETPTRPYRDLGVVRLDNCQDYRTPPCRTWLTDAACELGGHVAYLPQDGRPQTDFAPLTFRMLVAAYIADLRPDPQSDVVLEALTCDPPCNPGEVCSGGSCRPAEDCAEAAEPDGGEPPDRCVE
jgi:hypothetical protein